jgi:FkbM family methyltransferase
MKSSQSPNQPRSSALQKIKDVLVALGPDSIAVKTALAVHARRQGFRLAFKDGVICINRGGRRIVLDKNQFILVPIMLGIHDRFFQWVVPKQEDGCEVLDFSASGFHSYKELGVGFYFPGIAEDYSLDAYTHWYRPAAGDLVFDVGAHAGMTGYFLSRMVGPSGRVIAFEPDESNYAHLLRNIEYHQLTNVTPVRKAMAGCTGVAAFNMDGTMAAGLSEYLIYSKTGKEVEVQTISFSDACREFGVPAFVKMDIEGAEVDVIRSSLPFLLEKPVHFAFESYHRLRDGSRTWQALESLLRSISYTVESSSEFGEMFTWARPGASL